MTIQQQAIPYIEIPGVTGPVRTKVLVSTSDTRAGAQQYAQTHELSILDSQGVNNVYSSLERAKDDKYSSLAKNQPLVEAGKVSLNGMRLAIGRLYVSVKKRCKILTEEIADTNPSKRGFVLPEGKDTALYRGWRMKQDDIDVSGVDPIFVTSPTKYEWMPEEWRNVLGAQEHAHCNPENKHKGLNVLRWDFDQLLWPYLEIGYGLTSRLIKSGALVVSKYPMEELVSKFDAGMYQSLLKQQLEKRRQKAGEGLFGRVLGEVKDTAEDELEEYLEGLDIPDIFDL